MYLPQQYDYNDPVPTQNYLAFANAAGCGCDAIASTTFDCLVNADTLALQNASMIVSESGNFGTFAFIPVTDGDFLRERPSEQLVAKKVKGKRLLTGVSYVRPAVVHSLIRPSE